MHFYFHFYQQVLETSNLFSCSGQVNVICYFKRKNDYFGFQVIIVIVKVGSEHRTFEYQKHLKTGILSVRILNGKIKLIQRKLSYNNHLKSRPEGKILMDRVVKSFMSWY
jgi:hypothetical protein